MDETTDTTIEQADEIVEISKAEMRDELTAPVQSEKSETLELPEHEIDLPEMRPVPLSTGVVFADNSIEDKIRRDEQNKIAFEKQEQERLAFIKAHATDTTPTSNTVTDKKSKAQGNG